MLTLKKRILAVSATALCCISLVTPFNAFASESVVVRERINENAVIVREDVSLSEALSDPSFALHHQDLNVCENIQPNATTWEVWGTSLDTVQNGTTGAIPVGYSRHVNNGTTLSTWHYTRTYLGELFKKGDSGRQWGYDTVRADGTFCDYGVWEAHKHIVKYGTTD